MLGSTGIGLILKSIKVDYKFVLYPGDPIPTPLEQDLLTYYHAAHGISRQNYCLSKTDPRPIWASFIPVGIPTRSYDLV